MAGKVNFIFNFIPWDDHTSRIRMTPTDLPTLPGRMNHTASKRNIRCRPISKLSFLCSNTEASPLLLILAQSSPASISSSSSFLSSLTGHELSPHPLLSVPFTTAISSFPFSLTGHELSPHPLSPVPLTTAISSFPTASSPPSSRRSPFTPCAIPRSSSCLSTRKHTTVLQEDQKNGIRKQLACARSPTDRDTVRRQGPDRRRLRRRSDPSPASPRRGGSQVKDPQPTTPGGGLQPSSRIDWG